MPKLGLLCNPSGSVKPGVVSQIAMWVEVDQHSRHKAMDEQSAKTGRPPAISVLRRGGNSEEVGQSRHK